MIEAKKALRERLVLAALARTEEFVALLATAEGQIGQDARVNVQQEISNLRQANQTLHGLLQSKRPS